MRKSGTVALPDGRLKPRVLVDHSAVEIFANGKPLTARACPTLGGGLVLISANGAWSCTNWMPGGWQAFSMIPVTSSRDIDCSVAAFLGTEKGRYGAVDG
jgi:Glycosyl hydrolases family 32 C terminal